MELTVLAEQVPVAQQGRIEVPDAHACTVVPAGGPGEAARRRGEALVARLRGGDAAIVARAAQ
jgi:hypothetical protein